MLLFMKLHESFHDFKSKRTRTCGHEYKLNQKLLLAVFSNKIERYIFQKF